MSELVETLNRVKKRRVTLSSDTKGWYACTLEQPIEFSKGFLYWVDEFTTGKFFVDPHHLLFEKSEDAFAFKMGFGNAKKKL